MLYLSDVDNGAISGINDVIVKIAVQFEEQMVS